MKTKQVDPVELMVLDGAKRIVVTALANDVVDAILLLSNDGIDESTAKEDLRRRLVAFKAFEL